MLPRGNSAAQPPKDTVKHTAIGYAGLAARLFWEESMVHIPSDMSQFTIGIDKLPFWSLHRDQMPSGTVLTRF